MTFRFLAKQPAVGPRVCSDAARSLRNLPDVNDGGIFFGYISLWGMIGLSLLLIVKISRLGVLIFFGAFFVVGLFIFYPVLRKMLKALFFKDYRAQVLQEFHNRGATDAVPSQISDAIPQDNVSQIERRTITTFLIDKFGHNTILAFYLLVTICFIAGLLGYGNASKTTAFLLLKTPGNYAVIRNYGDLVIARGLDPVQKAFTSDFLIMKIPDNEKLSRVYSQVGSLSMPK